VENVLTVKEAADRLRVSPATIYILCAQGRLSHLRVGTQGRGTIRVREVDLQEFIDEATVREEARPGREE
jgi:excisionase family DNA binding protein